MFDLAKLHVIAGNGGHGRVSFRREKFIAKGGPDGGHGGDGGNVIVRSTSGNHTLQHLAGLKEIKAENGTPGGRMRLIGKRGEDQIIEVPVGTTLWLIAENKTSAKRRRYRPREGALLPEQLLKQYQVENPRSSGIPPRPEDPLAPLTVEDGNELDDEGVDRILRSDGLKNINLKEIPKMKMIEFTEPDQEFLLAWGGKGGRGNEAFKGSKNTTPLEADYGGYGEQKLVLIELKLFADVGLVGYPNAGKSTLLSIITRANPKVANYPFTTLEPQLGVMSVDLDDGVADLVIADIPGLIEGASQGKGLGYDFLRHIQGARVLLYLLTLNESDIFDDEKDHKAKAQLLFEQYQTLQKELFTFDEQFKTKPVILMVSKSDLYSQELQAEVSSFFSKKKLPIGFFSTITQEGLQELKRVLSQFASR